jgi:hypothetical protein
VALFLPDDVPAIEPGVKIAQALVELDDDTPAAGRAAGAPRDAAAPRSRGVRLGCEMLRLAGEGERQLQRYIDHNPEARRQLSL